MEQIPTSEKISLLIMGEKGLGVLEALIKNELYHIIDCVISDDDDNVLDNSYVTIQKHCDDNRIRFFNRTDKYEISSNFVIAISWRWLIEAVNATIIVLHDSLLPKYRGFAPLVNMLIHREPHIGVTGFIATKEFDRGDIVAQESVEIDYPIRVADALQLIIPLYTKIVMAVIQRILNHLPLQQLPQDESKATYSLWRDEEDYHINWNNSAEDIQQFIYSTGYPYKGAFSLYEGIKVRIIDCEPLPDILIMNRDVGKVLSNFQCQPIVVCGEGLLKLIEIRDENNNILKISKTRIRFY